MLLLPGCQRDKCFCPLGNAQGVQVCVTGEKILVYYAIHREVAFPPPSHAVGELEVVGVGQAGVVELVTSDAQAHGQPRVFSGHLGDYVAVSLGQVV